MDTSSREEESATQLGLLREKYAEEISNGKQELLSFVTQCCQKLGDYGEEAKKIDFDDAVEELLRLDNIGSKLRRLEHTWSEHQRDLGNLAYQQGRNLSLEEGRNCVQGLKNVVDSALADIHVRLSYIMRSIENCPEGREKALNFQRSVCILFEWLFVDKLTRRHGLERTFDGSQVKDGVFEVEEGYDPEAEFGCPFQYLYLECKNYGEPRKVKSRDLFQLFGYTLFATNTGIFTNIPLCLLVSRRNPNTNDLVWNQRWRIYERFDNRLILFLDEADLSRMVEYKLENDNPGKVIKDKIKEIQEDIARNVPR